MDLYLSIVTLYELFQTNITKRPLLVKSTLHIIVKLSSGIKDSCSLTCITNFSILHDPRDRITMSVRRLIQRKYAIQ